MRSDPARAHTPSMCSPPFDSRRLQLRKKAPEVPFFLVVGAPRIELGLSGPKPDVLPVYYAPERGLKQMLAFVLRPSERGGGEAVSPRYSIYLHV